MSKHSCHSHKRKINTDHLIKTVHERSKARGERLTSVRRDVVIAMSKLHEAQTAYQILAELNKKRTPKLSAMSLYRTLDFLIELGMVVKLESQNTYKLCPEHNHNHSHLMMVCDDCGETQEIDDHAAAEKLQALARKHGHTLKHHVIELHGICSHCGS